MVEPGMMENPMQGVAEVEQTLQRLQDYFKTGATKSAEWRKTQLRQVMRGLQELEEEFEVAYFKDNGRDSVIYKLEESRNNISEADFCLKHVETWMQPVRENVEAMLAPARQEILYEPLGVVAVYGAWNAPMSTTVKPLITAISAGNCCFVKPSEMSPNIADMIKKLVEKYLDTKAIAVINGGPELGKKMNSQKFDLICFTGSTQVGKIVATEAAKNLVPCILELGGKCPFIVDLDADVNTAATKCMMAKTLNSGQVCIAPDYILVHEKVLKPFVEACQRKLKDFFGDPSKLSSFQGMMVNKFHTERMQRIINTSGGKLICGGKVNIETRHVEPTIILEPSKDSELMRDEIFGCVLPVFPFENIRSAVKFVNTKEKPLTVYYFGQANTQFVAHNTSSGHFVANEVLFQFITSFQGFGGVGASGYGRHGGYEGFKNFSNRKGILIKGKKQPQFVLDLVAPPYKNQRLLFKLWPKLMALTQQQLLFWIVGIVGVLTGILWLLRRMCND